MDADEAAVMLTDLAEWFDNPNQSPDVVVKRTARGEDGPLRGPITVNISDTPGFLLREIRRALEAEGDE